MKCKKCGSENVNVQMVSETLLKTKHHGIIWWLLIGWWWKTILWVFLTLPMIIIKIFRPKKYMVKTTHKSMFICQDCGNNWKAYKILNSILIKTVI